MTRLVSLAVLGLFGGALAYAQDTLTFADIDVNNDGYVSQNEFIAFTVADGEVTAAEAMAKFTMLDADGNGVLTEQEMKPAEGEDSDQMPG